MHKIKSYFKKRYYSILLILCIILTLVIVIFLRSDTLYLIIPPKKLQKPQKQVSNKITQTTAAEKTKQNKKKLLDRIYRQYAWIQFITHDRQFIIDEDGAFAGVKDIIITSVPVPDSIKGIAGLDENFTYIDRMRAADALGENLSAPEARALLHFLHKKTSEDKLKPINLNAVKNQVAIALMRQIPANQEFPMHLIAMYYEKDFDITWRDYCIQFLGQCYNQIDTYEHKMLVRDTLFNALKDKKNIAAPAIIAIDGLSKYPGFVRSRIAEEAYKLASDPKTANIVKIPALQIAAKYNHPKAVILARHILAVRTSQRQHSSLAGINSQKQKIGKPQNRRIPVILKMSAIATIGAYGINDDIEMLNKYRKSADIRLRTAAKAAIKKLL